ncbi:hypothetical protein PHMEG_00015481 [Phytophthora megakarya]|uniref:Uncharacterized protein n=1 Tax=Phytophthora megakarya TaxID=4795 RepID=A0A225W1B7_9STRA|nr:hypothetical protein PHMEG_00015481 [Phytophthora megakarya]
MIRSVPRPKFVSAFDVPFSYYTRVLAKKNHQTTTITTTMGNVVFTRLFMCVSTAP